MANGILDVPVWWRRPLLAALRLAPCLLTGALGAAPGIGPAERERAFVVIDLASGEARELGGELAARRLSPASTFKIPHALIALETGALRDETVVEAWDGSAQPFASWQQDHTLGSAIQDSVVWFFQRTARRIGPERMARWLADLGYGNRDISGGIDRFWLGSTLAISPREQAALLARLWKDELPFDRGRMALVRGLLLWSPVRARELAPDWPADVPLAAKTGNARMPTADGSEQRVSWLVGHVRAGGRGHVFAAVVTGRGPMDRMEGARVAVDGLRELGVVPVRSGP